MTPENRNMKVVLALFSYGGVHEHTMIAVNAELDDARRAKHDVELRLVSDDALISRSRSKALSDFLAGEGDVLVMLDHDLEWKGGEAWELAAQADMRRCLVAGMYSKRAFGHGIAGRFTDPKVKVHPRTDERYEAEYLSTGFLAIPRIVAEEVLKAGLAEGVTPNAALTECIGLDGVSSFCDFFRPIVVPDPVLGEGVNSYASEDWAFSWRARKANPSRPQYFWAKPWLLHWGMHGFSLLDAVQPEPPTNRVTH